MNELAPNDKLAVSVGEAAKLLSLGRTTLYELVIQGQLRSIRVGRRILIPRDALLEFVNRQ